MNKRAGAVYIFLFGMGCSFVVAGVLYAGQIALWKTILFFVIGLTELLFANVIKKRGRIPF
jgi:hypothetical protein